VYIEDQSKIACSVLFRALIRAIYELYKAGGALQMHLRGIIYKLSFVYREVQLMWRLKYIYLCVMKTG
jgi:hypothetical protein